MKQILKTMTAILWMAVLCQFIWEKTLEAQLVSEAAMFDEMWDSFQQMAAQAGVTEDRYAVDFAARSHSKSREEQENLLVEAAACMGIGEDALSWNREVKSNGSCLSWEASTFWGSAYAQYLDLEEDYVVLHLEDRASVQSPLWYLECFRDFAQTYELTGVPCMEWTAFFPEELCFLEKNMLSETIFSLFAAQEVDGIRGEDLYTVYGYSDRMAPSIVVDQSRINVNLAFTDDEERGKTKIHLGIPVIQNNY